MLRALRAFRCMEPLTTAVPLTDFPEAARGPCPRRFQGQNSGVWRGAGALGGGWSWVKPCILRTLLEPANIAMHSVDCDTGPATPVPGDPTPDLDDVTAATTRLDGCQDASRRGPGTWGPDALVLTGPGWLPAELRYPAPPEMCSDNEIAHVLCSFPEPCSLYNLRSTLAEGRQPLSFCRPPTGQCRPGEWQMPANGRHRSPAQFGHHAFHMGCCTSCPGGANRCYHDCTCLCQTSTSCEEVQPMQKNCQTSQVCNSPDDNMLNCVSGGATTLQRAEHKIGCRWDPAARGCVDYSTSPTAAPTPKPTAWPTASPTKTQPPTAWPTVADCYVGGQAICVLGYYPLWCTEEAATRTSRDYQSRPIILGGVTYHMANIPPGGAWFGDYNTRNGVPTLGTTYGTPRAVHCITPGVTSPATLEQSSCSDVKIGDAPWRDALDGTCAQYKEHRESCNGS